MCATFNAQLTRKLERMDADQRIRLIVRYDPERVSRGTLMRGFAPTRAYTILPMMAVEMPAKVAQEMAAEESIVQVWEDLPVHVLLDVSAKKIHAPQLWQAGITGQQVKVAVVDTGIDTQHPDFAGRIVSTMDFSGKGTVQDGNGHGTHVTGIVAGSGAASSGMYRGIAPDASLYIAKALTDDGSGHMSDVIAGLEWAVQQNVQVVNLSLGSDESCDGSDALSTVCDEIVGHGIVVCVAAGNAGPAMGTVGSPGCAHKVITVGASTDNDQVASYSSRGPTQDGRVKPDLCFPGSGIISARAAGTSMGTPQGTYYTAASGTSMATPHCSGAAALLLQAFPHASPDEIKERLFYRAFDLSVNPNLQGHGRPDLVAAKEYTPSAGLPTPSPTPEPPPPTPPKPAPGNPGCVLGPLGHLLRGLFRK